MTRGEHLPGNEPADADERLLRYVESLALLFAESGMPRMAARVFAYALADDANRYTAADFARGLRISPAAVSGAVRFLVQSGMLGKEREPGARVDTYRVYDDDVWSAIMNQREPVITRWIDGMEEGLRQLEPNTPGWRRLRETQAYFEFMAQEMPGLMERWRQHRRQLFENRDESTRGSRSDPA